MERTPQDWDIGCLEAKELSGDGVHVGDHERVVFAGGCGKHSCEVEGRAVAVEALPPRDGIVVDEMPRLVNNVGVCKAYLNSRRSIPMPLERHHPVASVKRDSIFDSGTSRPI